jgi:hypothetical protein
MNQNFESDTKTSYVLSGWSSKDVPTEITVTGEHIPALVPLPGSARVREWCQAGKKVRVTFEIVEEP